MQTKRRRLVAETADDLQHILFGDSEEAGEGHAAGGDEQTALAIPVAEPEDVEVFSDSDRDSMDEFIVRDPNEDREQRYIQTYADQYGEDATEMLGDVIAVFGDLRILDLYSRDSSKYSRISPKKGESMEEKFDPEEVKTHFASSTDDLILKADCSERMQEDYGTSVCLGTFSEFESSPLSLEEQWMLESRWIYAVLSDRAGRSSVSDWTFWTPVEVQDKDKRPVTKLTESHSAINLPEHKSEVIGRIHACLRDMRGRGFEPLYMWYSMSRAKYDWYLNLTDLLDIRALDVEWTQQVFPKLSSVRAKLNAFSDSLDAMIDAAPSSSMFAESVRSELASVRSELQHQISFDGIRPDFSEILDDFAASLSAEFEPLVKHLESADGAGDARPASARPSSHVSTIISNKLHEQLIPSITLFPREVGENLAFGIKLHKGGGGRAYSFPEDGLAPALRSAVVEY